MSDEKGDATFLVGGHRIPARPLAPGLYVVATPIGNLQDMTLRALGVLAAADIVACEDTRVTPVLLRHYGISAKLTPYHDHNAATQRPKLLEALGEGKIVALVSDAGTPLVSVSLDSLPRTGALGETRLPLVAAAVIASARFCSASIGWPA